MTNPVYLLGFSLTKYMERLEEARKSKFRILLIHIVEETFNISKCHGAFNSDGYSNL